jgi:putative transposase
MLKAYEYRIYPTPQQEEIFRKTLGLCRLYWNLALSAKQQDHSALLGYTATFQKFKPEALEWMKEVDSVPLTQTGQDLSKAFISFFKSCKKQRKGKFVKPPKFKSKKNPKDSFRYSLASNPKFKDGKLVLTRRLGPIDIRAHRFCEGKFRNVTFKRTATGKWFVKICVEKREEKKCTNGRAVGVDWNCNDESFVTMSDGTKVKCPRFLKRREVHLIRHQRAMSKLYRRGAEEQSHNYEREKHRVVVIYERVSWQRRDWLHKLSREIADKYEYVVVEDINLQVMASKLHHGRAVGDQGFGMLRQYLSYKTNLIKVPAAYTSKTCHNCKSIKTSLTLSEREWTCPVCGETHDRDVNASLNILERGTKRLNTSRLGTYRSQNACGEPRSSVKQEIPKPSLEDRNVS